MMLELRLVRLGMEIATIRQKEFDKIKAGRHPPTSFVDDLP